MTSPVWCLSVDLQAKTATFQSGMADAARAARGAFNDIKGGSGEMGRSVSGSMMESRHGVMLLGEEFGVHLPRALTTFIASIGPVGAAMEAAFPFLAIAVGATLLIEHLVKMHEAGEKLTEDQMKFGTAVQNAFNSLDEKILQAEIRADELKKDHLGALSHQLELIDRQSMAELVHSFGEVAKAADIVFNDLKSHWYTFGIGASGAKHALDQFQTQYDSLLAQGKDKEAGGLLSGTLDQARKTLDMMHQLSSNRTGDGQTGDYKKDEQAAEFLREKGLLSKVTGDYTKTELSAQEAIVQALEAQVSVQDRIASLKTLEKGNATTSAHQADGKDAAKFAKEQAEALKRGREEMVKNIAEDYRRMVNEVDEGEREQIEATKQGSAARLAAIDAAIKEEEATGLQETGFYRSLLTQRVALVRQMAEEEEKLKAEAAREEASNTEKMSQLAFNAYKEHQALMDSSRRMTIERRMAEELEASQREYGIKLHALMDEANALDKGAKDYENKLKAIQDKEKQLVQQHANDLAQIKMRAEEESNARVLNAEQQALGSIASGLTQSIMGHQSWAKSLEQFGSQAAEGFIRNSLMIMMGQEKEKLSTAKLAAAHAYETGEAIGGPAGLILGPVFAAATFAGVMAFQSGTDRVPGYGTGDTVPAMLAPGEGVVPGGVMDGLSKMARSGEMGGGGPHYHAHINPTYNVQTIDGDGMQDALEKHSDQLQKHVVNTLRKMNR